MKRETEKFHKALFFTGNGDKITCTLCPHECALNDGQMGFCGVRRNDAGALVSLAYGHPTGFAVDPMEKKPLYHFYPGMPILSLGTLGCNMGCKFCQNHSSSQRDGTNLHLTTDASPDEVIQLALQQGATAIAFTYNEPIVWAEYMMDIAAPARANGIHTVAVTAGYITADARPKVFENIEAANIDLKAFSDDFYKKFSGASLEPVLDTLRWMRRETNIWMEITNLIIPGENDTDDGLKRLCAFVAEELGERTPVHFSAFHPAYKMADYPPTPAETIEKAYAIAQNEGLKYVYIGNIHTDLGRDTVCPECGKTVIARDWFRVSARNIQNGKCAFCGAAIDGVFGK